VEWICNGAVVASGLRTARKQLTVFPERCNQTVSLQYFQGAANTLSAPSVKRSLIFAVPATVLVAAYLLLSRMDTLSPARQELLVTAPYLISVVGMFLAVHFHRGRPFFILLLLALYYWCFQTFLPSGMVSTVSRGVYLTFVFLVPANITLFAAMRERGLFTPAGRMRCGFLAGQAFFATWLVRYRLVDAEPYLTRKFLQFPLLDSLVLPQPALLLAVLCVLVTTVLVVRRQAPVDSGLLGGQVAFLVACGGVARPGVTVAYCTAGALIVTLSILQDSYNMAFRDDLTGIPSRRALNEGLQGIGGRRYTIAMVDVDHFKKFNDTYGHDVGDQVLRMVARKIQDVGGGGKAYRYGGEEFTITFPGRSLADAIPHLEELRKAIAGYRLQLRGNDRPRDSRAGVEKRGSAGEGCSVSVTVSIGVAESGEGQNAADVIKSADRALYKAKQQGRNRVCR
jgi:diguanylate cyclase (GGDEF)-like protein